MRALQVIVISKDNMDKNSTIYAKTMESLWTLCFNGGSIEEVESLTKQISEIAKDSPQKNINSEEYDLYLAVTINNRIDILQCFFKYDFKITDEMLVISVSRNFVEFSEFLLTHGATFESIKYSTGYFNATSEMKSALSQYNTNSLEPLMHTTGDSDSNASNDIN